MLYNLRASFIRKFSFSVEISWKHEKTWFWQNHVFSAKIVIKGDRTFKLGFRVVRDAQQPQSKYDAKIRLCSRYLPKKRDFDKITFLALKQSKRLTEPWNSVSGLFATLNNLWASKIRKFNFVLGIYPKKQDFDKILFLALKQPKRPTGPWNSVSGLFATLNNLWASKIRKLNFVLGIYPKNKILTKSCF